MGSEGKSLVWKRLTMNENEKGMRMLKDKVLQAGESLRPAEKVHQTNRTKKGDTVVDAQSILRDITERKNVEKELSHERDLLHALMDNIPDAIYFKDANCRFTRVNRAHASRMGLNDPKEAIGKTDFDFYPDEFAREAYADEQRIVKTGKPLINKVEKIRMRDGRTRWVSATKVPITSKERRVTGIVGISRDITEQKIMEEALKESEERYRSLVELAPDGIITLNMKGVITSVNKTATRLSGYSENEFIGKHFSKMGFLQARDIPKYLKLFSSIVRGKTPEPIEFPYYNKDGNLRWVESHICFLEARGKKAGIQAILRDITERKQTEEALAYERDLLHSLMNNIPDAIYFKDAESRFTRTNKAHAQMIGVADSKAAIGKTDFDFYAEAFAREAYADEQDIVKTGKPMVNKIEKIRRPDGFFQWVSASKVPITDEMGRVIGIVGISRDITDRKRMEEDLRRYSEHLEELVEEKTRKLLEAERLATIGETAAMVGHDLRNPLQVIVNTSYLMRKMYENIPLPIVNGAKEKGFVDLLETIEDQVRYMNKIVADLQDFARSVKPEFVETSVRQLINETLSTVAVPENVEVSKMIPEDLQRLMADPALMKRVFTNLITNALQAMPNGGQLTIRARSTEEAIFISFQDTGLGIPEENLSKLFQPLFTTKPRGTGFGLPVCKRLVEAHNGNITVQSKVGKGSTFTVKLPL